MEIHSVRLDNGIYVCEACSERLADIKVAIAHCVKNQFVVVPPVTKAPTMKLRRP